MRTADLHNNELLKRSRFLGRYELVGALARGGMGSVYLARHAGVAGFHRLFAIKILHEHLAEKSAFVDMLRDEARIAARLHHPNVVPVVDLGTHGKDHYIVLDYVEGPSFSKLWKRSGGKLPRELSVSILLDTLEGLHAAHILKDDNGEDLHLIHRDVSPSNILVGIDGIARITDFGIAKAESRITSTQPGTRKGKLDYMSPEQVKDSRLIDRRTDIWSVGVILWNALTGERLFDADNDSATVEAIVNNDVRPPSVTEAKPPACFDEIVLRALERDPEKRYASALEMGEALRKTAAENDMIGSRQQLAAWIEKLFGDDLERRRSEIRRTVQRRSTTAVTNGHSQVTVLPWLSSPPPFTPTDKMALSSYLDDGEISTRQPTVPDLWPAGLRNRKYLWAFLALIATIVVGGIYIFYDRSTQSSIVITELKDEKPEKGKPVSSSGIAKPDLSPVSTPTGQSSEPGQAPEPHAKPDQSIDNAAEEDFSSRDENHRRSGRSSRRIRTVERTEYPAVVVPQDVSIPGDPGGKAAPAANAIPSSVPQTAPSSSSDDEFEKNPYLMR
ncbi:MAG: protein kinase [Deltaproteobacteria bacterium]|nr:protein kinase [Deltaproteobacteria bacterium]